MAAHKLMQCTARLSINSGYGSRNHSSSLRAVSKVFEADTDHCRARICVKTQCVG